MLLALWEDSLEHVNETDMKIRIKGIAAQLMKFEYFFGISLGLLILRYSDNLSKTMQKADISAAAGQSATAMVVSTLKSLRNDGSFDLFWQRTTATAEQFDFDKPALPCRRKAPRRFDDGCTPTFHSTVEDHFCTIYFEALDLIITCIEDRFNQPSYKTYQQVETLLIKAAAGEPYEEEIDFILSFYGYDFDSLLFTQKI